MKQTAVEWLTKIYLQTNKIDSFDIEQAKAMEKEQTLLFSEEYDEYVFRGGSATMVEYYNEIFKSE
jgi:hypothetical protein